VYREVVDGFQEFTVIMPRLSPVRLRRIKYFQHDRPIALRHPCQHVRLPYAGHAVIRTKPDSGIRQKRMSGIPSTQPNDVRRAVVAPTKEPSQGYHMERSWGNQRNRRLPADEYFERFGMLSAGSSQSWRH
jgi:hypothetical protein